MRIGPRHIPDSLYKKILQSIPISCVDVVIVCGSKFLLGKRKNKPMQGVWWFVGGRVIKGEKLEEAVRRHVAREMGVRTVKIEKFLTTCGTMFKDSVQGPPAHTINSVFLVKVVSRDIAALDGEMSEWKWFQKINKKWPPHIQRSLRVAGFQ